MQSDPKIYAHKSHVLFVVAVGVILAMAVNIFDGLGTTHWDKPVMCVIWFNPQDRPMRQVDLKYSLSTCKDNKAQRSKGYPTEGLIHDHITSNLQSCGFNPSQPTLTSVLSPHTCLSWWLSLYFHGDRGGPATPVTMVTCRPSDVALETGPLITYCACWGQRMTPIGGSEMTEWIRYHLSLVIWNREKRETETERERGTEREKSGGF